MEGDSVSRVCVVYIVVLTLRYAFPPTLKSKKENPPLFPNVIRLDKKNVYSLCLTCLIFSEHQKLKCNETANRKHVRKERRGNMSASEEKRSTPGLLLSGRQHTGASSHQELRSRWILHIKDTGLARRRDKLPLILSREEIWAVRQCSR